MNCLQYRIVAIKIKSNIYEPHEESGRLLSSNIPKNHRLPLSLGEWAEKQNRFPELPAIP